MTVDGGGIGDTITANLGAGFSLTLTGLTITGSDNQQETDTLGTGLLVFGGSLTLRQCNVIGNDRGVFVIGGSGQLVEECIFSDHWRSALVFTQADGSTTVVESLFTESLFTDNHTFSVGGGLLIEGSVNGTTGVVVVAACEFDANLAEFIGAGAFFGYLGSVHMTQTLFTNNVSPANAGALITNQIVSFLAEDCRFFGNLAGLGGGAFVDSMPGLSVEFERCLFVDNDVTVGGGAIACSINGGDVVLRRCTMANSTSPGATAVRAVTHHVLIENSIIWGNGPGPLFQMHPGGSVDVRYSDVQGGIPGIGNFDLDPLFTDPANGFQYSLQPGYPCIDAGDPDHSLDPDGSVVDLGAIPFQPSSASPLAGMGPRFLRGDVNAESQVDLADPIALLNHLFSTTFLSCEDRADANDDGQLDIADPIRLLGFLFASGDAPAAPYPSCWWDGSVDALRCVDVGVCP